MLRLYYLLASCPTTPPTAAPPTVPSVLPPVRTAPPTAPTPAPIAVFFPWRDIPPHALRLNSTVNTTVALAILFDLFIRVPLFDSLGSTLPTCLHSSASPVPNRAISAGHSACCMENDLLVNNQENRMKKIL